MTETAGEREAFEKWAKPRWPGYGFSYTVNCHGELLGYRERFISDVWVTWNAALASREAQPVAVPPEILKRAKSLRANDGGALSWHRSVLDWVIAQGAAPQAGQPPERDCDCIATSESGEPKAKANRMAEDRLIKPGSPGYSTFPGDAVTAPLEPRKKT